MTTSGFLAYPFARSIEEEAVRSASRPYVHRHSYCVQLLLIDEAAHKASSLSRRLLNRLSPSHNLPPEILADIFSLVPEGFNPGACDPIWGSSAIAPAHQLTPLTEVCHYWRDVALKTPFLWSTLATSRGPDDPTICYFPNKCPSGPLYVHLEGSPSVAVLDVLQRDGERVKEIHTDFVPTHSLKGILDFNGKNVTHCNVGNGWVDLPPLFRLFRGYTTALRTLSIVSLESVPAATGFPELRHLALEFRFESSDVSHLHDILNFLAGCPRLESLRLERMSENGPTPPPTSIHLPRQRVTLPRLRTLYLEETTLRSDDGVWDTDRHSSALTFWSALLPHLAPPRTCLFRVASILAHELGACAAAVREARAGAGPAFGCMRIGPPSLRNGWGLAALPETYALQLTGADGRGGNGAVCFDVLMPGSTFSAYPFSQAHEHLASALAASPLLFAVRELHVPSRSAIIIASWPRSPANGFLGALTHLETLIVSIRRILCDIVSVLAALDPTPTPDAHGGASVACPNLSTLVVCLEDERQIAYLCGLLERRARAGCPVRRLTIGFVKVVDDEVYAHARGLVGVEGVEEMRVMKYGEDGPMELLWREKAPRGCWDRKEEHRHWEMWA